MGPLIGADPWAHAAQALARPSAPRELPPPPPPPERAASDVDDAKSSFASMVVCGAARGGAPRQALAVDASALFRLRFADDAGLGDADTDLTARLGANSPCLAEESSAAREDRLPRLSGSARFRRNLLCHEFSVTMGGAADPSDGAAKRSGGALRQVTRRSPTGGPGHGDRGTEVTMFVDALATVRDVSRHMTFAESVGAPFGEDLAGPGPGPMVCALRDLAIVVQDIQNQAFYTVDSQRCETAP